MSLNEITHFLNIIIRDKAVGKVTQEKVRSNLVVRLEHLERYFKKALELEEKILREEKKEEKRETKKRGWRAENEYRISLSEYFEKYFITPKMGISIGSRNDMDVKIPFLELQHVIILADYVSRVNIKNIRVRSFGNVFLEEGYNLRGNDTQMNRLPFDLWLIGKDDKKALIHVTK